jgi:2-amino-4-hydroxy-6-hydroxymethyldihydropteridine diphosphokinase
MTPPPAHGVHLAYVGLGANLGDARGTVQAALAELAAVPGVNACRASSLWRSAPVQASGPDFVNAVAELHTSLEPMALLNALQAFERRHGRERPYPNAPRTLDLDLLAHGEAVINTQTLQLPHPRLHHRAFVLRPLLELAPDLALPGLGPLAAWLSAVTDQPLERLAP